MVECSGVVEVRCPYDGVVECSRVEDWRLGVVDDSTVECCVVLLPYPLVVECSGVVEDSTVEVRCPYEGVVEDSKVLLSVVVSWYLEGVVSLSVNLGLERCVVLLPYPLVVECSGVAEDSTVEVRCPYEGVVECSGLMDDPKVVVRPRVEAVEELKCCVLEARLVLERTVEVLLGL